MAIGAAAVFVGATVFGAVEARKREKRTQAAQERATRTEVAISQHQARQATRRQIREARVQRAQVEAQALASGQGGSSAAIASQGSLQTQLAQNVGTIQTATATSGVKHAAEMDIFRASQKSDLERLAGVTQSVSSRFIS